MFEKNRQDGGGGGPNKVGKRIKSAPRFTELDVLVPQPLPLRVWMEGLEHPGC